MNVSGEKKVDLDFARVHQTIRKQIIGRDLYPPETHAHRKHRIGKGRTGGLCAILLRNINESLPGCPEGDPGVPKGSRNNNMYESAEGMP